MRLSPRLCWKPQHTGHHKKFGLTCIPRFRSLFAALYVDLFTLGKPVTWTWLLERFPSVFKFSSKQVSRWFWVLQLLLPIFSPEFKWCCITLSSSVRFHTTNYRPHNPQFVTAAVGRLGNRQFLKAHVTDASRLTLKLRFPRPQIPFYMIVRFRVYKITLQYFIMSFNSYSVSYSRENSSMLVSLYAVINPAYAPREAWGSTPELSLRGPYGSLLYHLLVSKYGILCSSADPWSSQPTVMSDLWSMLVSLTFADTF